MKTQKEQKKLTETTQQDTKPRFEIEQLEERIAPWRPCKVTGNGERCVGPPTDRNPGGPI